MTGQGSISISSANKNPAGVSARQAWHVVHRQWRQPAFPQSGDCDDEEYSASSSPCRDSAGRCDPSHPLSNSLSSLCGSSRRQRSRLVGESMGSWSAIIILATLLMLGRTTMPGYLRKSGKPATNLVRMLSFTHIRSTANGCHHAARQKNKRAIHG